MKKLLLAMVVALTLVSCGGKKTSVLSQLDKYKEFGITGVAQDSLSFVVESNEKFSPEALAQEEACLNDLRFYGWTDDTWGCNNYIRTIRIFLDAFAAGEVNQEFLKSCEWDVYEKYKEAMGGNFVVVDLECPILGGIAYYVVPLDNPNLIISAWVYSFVTDDGISGYDIRHFEVGEIEGGLISAEDVEKLRKGEIDCIVW